MSRVELTAVRDDAVRDHDAVAPLVPWYVNGTLSTLDARRVAAHLTLCEACRADEQAQRSIARSMREGPAVELAPQAGLAAVMERIERRESRRRLWSLPLRLLHGGGTSRPLALAVGVQALVIVMLTAVLWVKVAPPASYRTLSTPAPTAVATATLLRLVLEDDMSLGQLRDALAPWHSRIVGGPDGRGIYTVAVDGDGHAALAALRATPGVSLAELVSAP